MLTDPFCEIPHRQNTNHASSHHIAPLDAARAELKRHEICVVFLATLLNSMAALVSTERHGSTCISQATYCTKMFQNDFVNMHQKCSNCHQHKISTFIIRSMNVTKPHILFPAFQATNYKPVAAPIRYLSSTTFLACEILSTAITDTWR